MGKRDEELIIEVQSGSAAAMEELFQRYKRSIFNYALKILSNRADAEDVVSEVFIILFSRQYSYSPTAKFSTWLYTVAHNVSISRIRKRRRWLSVWFKKEDGEDFSAWEIPDTRTLPAEDLEQKETAWYVKKAIAKLPSQQREVLVLREYQGLSYEEIARVLNISLAQVKILIFRGRERLREELRSFMKEANDV